MSNKVQGVDISHWQGQVDFNKMKAAGAQFVLIKAGGSDAGYYTDSMFHTYYAQAKAAGMKIGAYYFANGNFLGARTGTEEAQRMLKICKGKDFDLPLFIDIERNPNGTQNEGTAAAIAFCNCIRCNGFQPGVYGSDISTFQQMLHVKQIQEDDSIVLWVARYNTAGPQYVKPYDIWQYSGSGRIAGCNTDIDLNYYIDTQNIFEQDTSQSDEITRIAREVLDGKWGNGAMRIIRLKSAGYDSTEIQKRVNELLAEGRK